MKLTAISFENLLATAIRLPGVKVDREKFLFSELKKYCNKEQIALAVEHNPAFAKIDVTIINKIAQNCINHETTNVTAISTIAGIPGGLAVVGTIPADLLQYFAHICIILQKLIYLYGWAELFEEDNLDDESKNLIILFAGVMFGISYANSAIAKLAEAASSKIAGKVAQQAFMKSTIQPITKRIMPAIMTKFIGNTAPKMPAKAIPLVGGAVSGGLTYFTFKPMAVKLRKYLSTLQLCDVNFYANASTSL